MTSRTTGRVQLRSLARRVTLDESSGAVCVCVQERGDRLCACPECRRTVPRYDKRTRPWRHLDSCQYKTIVSREIPRVECPEHGIRQIPVPWADSNATLTAQFEVSFIDWLKEASASAVARRCRLSWDAVDGVIARAVARGLARREVTSAEHISIDETSFQERHEHVTIVTDSTTGALLHVADARSTASREEFYSRQSQDQRDAIRSVSMDMWEPYVKATRVHLPYADLPAGRQATRSASTSTTSPRTSATLSTRSGEPNIESCPVRVTIACAAPGISG